MLEADNIRLLIDCGLYQERELKARNWAPFPIPPNSLDAVLLTHAHIDHCGLLPRLVREGFHGKVYCTAATSDIAQIMLLDSADLQQEDAEFKRKRHQKEGRKGPYPELPLYTTEDAKASLSLFSPVSYGQPIQIDNSIEAVFYNAGHVLGSSAIKIRLNKNGEQRIILFSGDVGRWNKPILQDPTLFSEADYILIESTYGDRLHGDSKRIGSDLAEIINSTITTGGNIVIPSFALERSQEILYYLNELLTQNRIPHLIVFVDSPMAVSLTEIFENHPELFDKEMMELMRRRKSPFDFPSLKMIRSVEESKAINRVLGTVIIIAGSGMCTGGRIKHHLVANISKRESTILFIGYQAVGTLGRQIVDGAQNVRIFGQMRAVKARVAQMQGFSAHADRDELFRWLSGFTKSPKHLFVTHGEAQVAFQFADFLKEKTNWEISVPAYQEEVQLD